jgi:Tfp pilus assembly protein PilO
MAAVRFSSRERTLVLATLSAAVFYVFFQFLIVPKLDEINDLKLRARDRRSELRVAEGKIRILDNLEKRPGGATIKTVIVPREERALAALKNIAQASKDSGLSLLSIQPVVDNQKEGFTFNLVCAGSFRTLYKFLIVLQQQHVLIFIDNLDIENKGESVLSINMVLTAYY